jgi:TonB-linked SusC/RagA family outer membrane protein
MYLSAQNITQTGTVVDELNEPMIGVTVAVKGMTIGTTTNLDGDFSLSCPTGSTLIFSYIGYKTVEFKATGSKMAIKMEEDALILEEVVVVPYGGFMPKKHVAGAMSVIGAEAIGQRNAVSVFDALQGSAPGLQITANSGAPGSSSFVTMRGASTFDDAGVSPLFVVDGVIVDNIDNIAPNDIHQIDVIKDAASAAIYGARSANGVILITTKSGQAGKPRVDITYRHSFRKVANKIPQVNAFESRLSMAATDLNNPSKILEKFSARTDSVGLQYTTNYYYQDLLFQTGSLDDVNARISGGTKEFKYNASLTYMSDKGVILTSFNDKFNASVNTSYNPWKNVEFITRIRLSNSKNNKIKDAVLQDASRRDPDMIIWYPDGELIPYYASGGRRNPIAELKQKRDETEQYNGNFYQAISWKFTPWLKFDANVSADFNSKDVVIFSSKYLEGSDNGKNAGSNENDQRLKYTGEAYLNFNKTFGNDHVVNAMVGSSIESLKGKIYKIGGSYYLSEDIYYMNMATVLDQPNVYTTGYEESMASFFGRAGYSWKGRYTLTGTIRYDGSSLFGDKNRWGAFPSISGSWRFSDEEFMRSISDILYDGKLRLSYGVTGNDRIKRYEHVTTYTASGSYNEVGGIAPNDKYGNPMLKWEQTTQSNFGIDLAFLNGRISFNADYYIKKTKDLLSDLNLPYTTGYDKIRVNLAGIENRGIELTLAGTPVRTRDFNWHTTINWWKNKNKITELSREDYIHDGAWLVAKGHTAGIWYGYKSLGVYEYDASNAYTKDYSTRLTPVFQRDAENNVIIGLNGQPTLVKYLLPNGSEYTGEVGQMTVNGVIAGGGDVIWYNKPDERGDYDNIIDSNDQKELGEANPDWFASWNNNFNYKNISLSFNFYMSWGGLIWNDLKRYYSSWGGNTHKQTPEYIMQGWKYPGEITDWYALNSRERKTNNQSMSLNSMFLEDASFVRLQSLRLGYELDQKLLARMPFNRLEVSVYGNNLLTWTNYSGFDPELGGGVLAPGKDKSVYPKNREFGLGISVGF